MTDDKLADEIERQVNHPGNLARMGIAAPKVVWFKDDAYWQQIIAALRRSEPALTAFIPGECSAEYTNALALSRALLSGPDFNGEANLHADTVAERHDALRRQPSSDKVMYALEESVKLQSHYASLLNMHDGGERIAFENATAWLKRLAELAAAEAEGHHE